MINFMNYSFSIAAEGFMPSHAPLKNNKILRNKFNQGGSVQFSSVTQSCPTLCDPMNRSMSGLPVHHQLPEFTPGKIEALKATISMK